MQNSGKKIVSKIMITMLSFVCFLLVLLSSVVSYIAFSNPKENTAQLFNYKIFVCENDIEGTDIEKGSLLLIKDTNLDYSYTPEILEKQSVLVIKGLGAAIKNDGLFIAVSLTAIPTMFFMIILFNEIKKILQSRAEKRLNNELKFEEQKEEIEELTAS